MKIVCTSAISLSTHLVLNTFSFRLFAMARTKNADLVVKLSLFPRSGDLAVSKKVGRDPR